METNSSAESASEPTSQNTGRTAEPLANELTYEQLVQGYDWITDPKNHYAEDYPPYPPKDNPKDPVAKLILRTPKFNCKHENADERTKNRFLCPDCGYMFKRVRQSVLRRRMMLK